MDLMEEGDSVIMKFEDKKDSDIWLDLEKLKIIGILQCDGDVQEKLTELYHVLQDNN